MDTRTIALVLAIAGPIFSAGIFYAGVQSLRKDLNGLGKKMRDQELRRLDQVKVMIWESRDHDSAKRIAGKLLP
jgi:hypothetical protein